MCTLYIIYTYFCIPFFNSAFIWLIYIHWLQLLDQGPVPCGLLNNPQFAFFLSKLRLQLLDHQPQPGCLEGSSFFRWSGFKKRNFHLRFCSWYLKRIWRLNWFRSWNQMFWCYFYKDSHVLNHRLGWGWWVYTWFAHCLSIFLTPQDVTKGMNVFKYVCIST